MQAINKIFFSIESETQSKSWKIGDVELVQATHLIENPVSVKQTEGTVISAPKSTGLIEGDKIHFHRNTIQDESCIDVVNRIYFTDMSMIFFAERNNEVIMFNDYLLVEKVKQQDIERKSASGLLYIPNTAQVKEYNIGIIRYIGPNQYDLQPGDKIVYCKHIKDGLTIPVFGEDLLRFQIDRVEAKLD